MPSSKNYLDHILDRLSGLEEMSYRSMMGEYILYYRGKIIGGIYDDRLLIKPVKAAKDRLPEAFYECPYEGAKQMLRLENTEDKAFLQELFQAMESELPAAKPKKKS